MIYLKSGLRISLVVLEILRNDEELKDVDVSVACFTNCRECGLTFTVYTHPHFSQTTYCVYEHRNSDEIIVNHKEDWCGMNGDLPYMADSKYKYDASFSYNEYEKCAQFLKDKFLQWVESHKEEPTKERKVRKEVLQNAVSTL